jgi:hypothetical protein
MNFPASTRLPHKQRVKVYGFIIIIIDGGRAGANEEEEKRVADYDDNWQRAPNTKGENYCHARGNDGVKYGESIVGMSINAACLFSVVVAHLKSYKSIFVAEPRQKQRSLTSATSLNVSALADTRNSRR